MILKHRNGHKVNGNRIKNKNEKIVNFKFDFTF